MNLFTKYVTTPLVGLLLCTSVAFSQDKPNILVIWGDDIGQSNISAYTRGMMGYQTPNIDRIASMGHKPKLNKDGSFVVMLGPGEAPEGWGSNYVRTLPDRGWFPYIRAYGAKKEFFDGTYKLPNIHRVKNFDKWIK